MIVRWKTLHQVRHEGSPPLPPFSTPISPTYPLFTVEREGGRHPLDREEFSLGIARWRQDLEGGRRARERMGIPEKGRHAGILTEGWGGRLGLTSLPTPL